MDPDERKSPEQKAREAAEFLKEPTLWKRFVNNGRLRRDIKRDFCLGLSTSTPWWYFESWPLIWDSTFDYAV